MRAILGLGGNEGGPLRYLRMAVAELSFRTPGVRVLRASPVYQSEAMLPPGGALDPTWVHPFHNMALECEIRLEPLELLAAVKGIERKLGREVRERWAPRRIDIDILALEGRSFRSPELEIPHPGLRERPFALLPLLDLWPEWASTPWSWTSSEKVPFCTSRIGDSLTELVGIVNVTPDSFSDGGGSPDLRLMLNQGATVLDVGAESTRPGAHPVDAETEWSRLAPTLDKLLNLRKELRYFRISVDTRKPLVAQRAIEAGVDWINDVEGLSNPEMQKLAQMSSVKWVVMHSLGIPPDGRNVLTDGQDPVEQILAWGRTKLAELGKLGISRERLILDPGIGFGKLAHQSWSLLSRASRLHELGVPLLFGHSRKSFLAQYTEARPPERDLETAVVSAELARQGVQYLRVHNVAASSRAIGVRWT
jgi:2-amino-4-hydroxy-6-hydroxymethyldihydropteridine diphosphokinase/dihydropteroate synthase